MDDLFGPPKEVLPSKQLALMLSGKQNWDDAPASIQSWGRYYIHEAAVQIMRLDTIEKRRTALGKLPDTIRPKVELEVRRLWLSA